MSHKCVNAIACEQTKRYMFSFAVEYEEVFTFLFIFSYTLFFEEKRKKKNYENSVGAKGTWNRADSVCVFIRVQIEEWIEEFDERFVHSFIHPSRGVCAWVSVYYFALVKLANKLNAHAWHSPSGMEFLFDLVESIRISDCVIDIRRWNFSSSVSSLTLSISFSLSLSFLHESSRWTR